MTIDHRVTKRDREYVEAALIEVGLFGHGDAADKTNAAIIAGRLKRLGFGRPWDGDETVEHTAVVTWRPQEALSPEAVTTDVGRVAAFLKRSLYQVDASEMHLVVDGEEIPLRTSPV